MTHIPAKLRHEVILRAPGRCEYCRVPDGFGFHPHEVDHIRAEKHRGATISSNLCLCCWICNRHKGTDLTSVDPETGQVASLFNPRTDKWADHFRLNGVIIQPLTPEGRVTVELLQLNRPDRLEERRILVDLGLYL